MVLMKSRTINLRIDLSYRFIEGFNSSIYTTWDPGIKERVSLSSCWSPRRRRRFLPLQLLPQQLFLEPWMKFIYKPNTTVKARTNQCFRTVVVHTYWSTFVRYDKFFACTVTCDGRYMHMHSIRNGTRSKLIPTTTFTRDSETIHYVLWARNCSRMLF